MLIQETSLQCMKAPSAYAIIIPGKKIKKNYFQNFIINDCYENLPNEAMVGAVDIREPLKSGRATSVM